MLLQGLSHRDTLIWWRHTPTMGYYKIFVSNPSSDGDNPNYLNSDKYEVKGHYNLVVRQLTDMDAGTYICDVTGHKNYSASLTVVGK